ncbi:MAG: CPBP family intramembrane metalloprotease, partial [Ruminiclostridium sp.]|nr:CPBP family intramembrane metalloprotease [Ruminiclostridium sp.]
MNYSTALGMIAIGIGGASSALWGVIVSVKYKKATVKGILLDFINVRQSPSSYLLAFVFLILDFCCVPFGGGFQISIWYMPIIIFLKAIIFGGIEEIGWRYTFQPLLEEKVNYIFSTFITFLSWGVWHFLYFYIEGSLNQVQAGAFLLGLLTNCFILSALYNKTKSLWICAMT